MPDFWVSVKTAPTSYPVTRTEAKAHCVVPTDVSADDTLIDNIIAAATNYTQKAMKRQLMLASLYLYMNRFPYSCESGPVFDGTTIILPRPPLSSVTAITYLDVNGASQTWSSTYYRVSAGADPGRIALAYNQSYPSIRDIQESIRIEYIAGYASASAVPQEAKQAILLMCGNMYRHREPVITGTITAELPLSYWATVRSMHSGAFYG